MRSFTSHGARGVRSALMSDENSNQAGAPDSDDDNPAMTEANAPSAPAEAGLSEPEASAANEPTQSVDDSRRGALRALVVVGSVAYGGALAVPSCQFLSSTGADGAAPREDAPWLRTVPLKELTEGTPQRVRITGEARDSFTVARGQTLGSVWLTRKGEQVSALSAECPHLGCAIGLGADSASFGCPCHTSRFALNGEAESGPSPRRGSRPTCAAHRRGRAGG